MLIKIQQKGCERDSLPGTLQRTVPRLRAWKGKRSGQHSGAGFSKFRFICDGPIAKAAVHEWHNMQCGWYRGNTRPVPEIFK